MSDVCETWAREWEGSTLHMVWAPWRENSHFSEVWQDLPSEQWHCWKIKWPDETTQLDGWQEGWRALYLGMSSGTAVLGSSSWLKMQLSCGRRKARSLYETSISVSPKPYSQGFIVSATELGSIEVLKCKHLKATLQLKALGLMLITFYHAVLDMCVEPSLKS